MKIFLSYRDYLRNFESFLSGFDPSESGRLEITTRDKWVNVHPVVLTMIAALSQTVEADRITIDDVTATSGHYLARMGLFSVMGKPLPYSIEEHEPAGRFIPITQMSRSPFSGHPVSTFL